ncbi:hypothetical protein BWQ96_09961 [Gracilariopsis chorda]|uniref:Uncharacterized protein n=1 Tax=Gracilariopsis chorda TaxID=448386 RepID=A0A2V3IGQ8_9FLOR|nr:hypothetical protein BWQ96_09961 [Gracilariopsis chorda]|eukprot:PXF40330.1 hypothetical protein BWQ96_09961 [Gracilariopsis chorda]
MYKFMSDKTLTTGPKFVFRSALTFLRETHTWNMILQSQQMLVGVRCQNQSDEVGPTSNQSTGPGQQHAESQDRSTVHRRPTGTKRALEVSNQVAALNKGAERIDKMAATSMKWTKGAGEMLGVDKQRALIELFSMSGTDPQLREKCLMLKQRKALLELEQELREGTGPQNTDSYALTADKEEPVDDAGHRTEHQPVLLTKKTISVDKIGNINVLGTEHGRNELCSGAQIDLGQSDVSPTNVTQGKERNGICFKSIETRTENGSRGISQTSNIPSLLNQYIVCLCHAVTRCKSLDSWLVLGRKAMVLRIRESSMC